MNTQLDPTLLARLEELMESAVPGPLGFVACAHEPESGIYGGELNIWSEGIVNPEDHPKDHVSPDPLIRAGKILDGFTAATAEAFVELFNAWPALLSTVRRAQELEKDKAAALKSIKTLDEAVQRLAFRTRGYSDEMSRYEALKPVQTNMRRDAQYAERERETAAKFLRERVKAGAQEVREDEPV